MRYLLLIYDDETAWEAMSEEEKGPIYGEYMALTEALKAEGKHLGGEPLQPTATATTVRVREGKTLTTDGPFAETKEQLGGYYMVDAENLDEAIALAARIPGARYGSVEVRPIWEVGGGGG